MDSKVALDRASNARMRKLVGFLSLMFVMCSLSGQLASAQAQSAKVTVSGIATDAGGSPLQGARVALEPTGKQVATEDDGQFRITDVAPGDYTLTVSYVGLAPFSQSIEVAENTRVDAKLDVASRSDSVVVTASRAQGDAEAINIERTSDNIVQVLPANLNHQPSEHQHCRRGRAGPQRHVGARRRRR